MLNLWLSRTAYSDCRPGTRLSAPSLHLSAFLGVLCGSIALKPRATASAETILAGVRVAALWIRTKPASIRGAAGASQFIEPWAAHEAQELNKHDEH